MIGPVFSLRELNTNLKKQFLTLKILVKPLDFVVNHYIKIIYTRIFFFFFFFFFFRDLRFLGLFLYFRSETRILKEKVVQKPDCFRLIVSK